LDLKKAESDLYDSDKIRFVFAVCVQLLVIIYPSILKIK
jgi:hypothetical protein